MKPFLLIPAAILLTQAALSAAPLAKEDEAFVKKAAIGGMTEVKLGDLAKSKGKDQKVKDFGARMVTDHGKANAELKKIAESKGAQVPADLDAKHQATVDHLSKLSDAQFDKAYVEDMVADHKKDAKEFETAAQSLKDPDLKAFAEKTLGVVKQHLSHVEGLQKGMAK